GLATTARRRRSGRRGCENGRSSVVARLRGLARPAAWRGEGARGGGSVPAARRAAWAAGRREAQPTRCPTFQGSNSAQAQLGNTRSIVEAIADRDATLADQLRRAATSAALNTAEAGRRKGRDQRNRARIAAGECAEAVAAVRIGIAWGWVADAAAAPAFALA